jgi:hypothetical protein
MKANPLIHNMFTFFLVGGRVASARITINARNSRRLARMEKQPQFSRGA